MTMPAKDNDVGSVQNAIMTPNVANIVNWWNATTVNDIATNWDIFYWKGNIDVPAKNGAT